MMDGSHMAFAGHLDAGSRISHEDMSNLHFDFESFITPDHTLSAGFPPYDHCIHDDTCLHFPQSGKSQEKNQLGHAQTPPVISSSKFPRNQSQLDRRDHTRSKSQMNRPSSLDQSEDYNWDTILSESGLANCNFQTGVGGMDGYCKDDDCISMTCSSACEGSCPSQCGETSRAVCCDDDACGTPQLCVDEDCHGADRPCTDTKCVVDPSVGTLPPAVSPAITSSDKAAAAALASFGGNQPPMMQNAFLQPSLSTNPRHGFVSLPNMPCGDLSMDSLLANVNGHPAFPNQQQPVAFEVALANHILQHHDPTHGLAHQGFCVANDPSQLIAKCTLPKYNPNDPANTDPYLPQIPSHECGFTIHDPNEFAQHIFQEHRPNLMMHAHQYGLSGPSHAHCHSNTHHHYDNSGPFFNFNAAPSSKPFSPSLSPLTNLSMGPSLSTTPASLSTPSPLSSELPLEDLSSCTKLSLPPVETEARVMVQEDHYICRWVIGTDLICGQQFENDEQLQKHCKHDHLKQLKKVNDGFKCGWEGCTRNTCFTQRSKVERHMQVHTGYKPVQCSICGASLSAKQALDQHMRIHTGETPWACTYPGCNCAFKQQSALTMHARTHTGDKPLVCETCGKRFSESSNLSKHRRTHNLKGLHECQLCGKDFHRLDQLRRHMGSNHKDRPTQVNALLSEAKNKIKTHKVTKVKKTKGKTREGKVKPEVVLNFEDESTFDMLEGSIRAVALQS